MAKPQGQKRHFSGMGYREVQRSNRHRRGLLPPTDQAWLKAQGYRNVGWEAVIQLYQAINDLLSRADADDPSLEELFLEADRIGQPYQTPEEVAAFHQQMSSAVTSISELIDQQFPDAEGEAIDYGRRSRRRAKKPPAAKKRP